MKQKSRIIEGYDKTSQAYADNFYQELVHKPLDRRLLQAFAQENGKKGIMADFGCGPGQTTQYLHQAGVENLMGIDISPGMVEVARKLNSALEFVVGDMLRLDFPENHFGSAICFYGIVHFTYEELTIAFSEIRRVLQNGGQFLFSFHIGDQTNHMEEFLGQAVQMDFYFFEVEKVLEILQTAGWKQKEVVERYPYEGHEYPSRRAYVWVEK